MQELVQNIMNQFGYPGIGLLILVETVFPPIPSEVILTFGGFLTTCTELTVMGVIASSTIASLAGAWILYGLGRLLSPKRLQGLASGKLAKRLGFQEKEVGDTFAWFEKKGEKAVFFGRCVPIIRSLISIPAGMAGMRAGRFTAFTLAGSLIWDTMLVLLGAMAGESWGVIMEYTDAYSALVKLGAATVCAVALMRFWGECRKKGKAGRGGQDGKKGNIGQREKAR